MAAPLIFPRVVRRTALIIALLGASAVTLWFFSRIEPTFPRLVYVTGWSLLAAMLCLTAYNARKKLSFLPLLSSRTWFQVHVYLGLFTGLVFILHLRWHWPAGWFQTILASLFVGVTGSGIFGWWLSRVMPHRLTTAGGEVPFDRIPLIRRALREQAESLAVATVATAEATTLADFYTARLADYFASPPHFFPYLAGTRRRVISLIDEIRAIGRFLKPAEKIAVEQLVDLIRQRDNLDFHRAGGLLLKGWLFVHIPLTYGLLVFSAVHVIVVYGFSGGAR